MKLLKPSWVLGDIDGDASSSRSRRFSALTPAICGLDEQLHIVKTYPEPLC